MAHSLEPRRTSSHRFERRATTPACASSSDLYTRPQASDTLPVYEDVTLEWNPGCVTIGSSTVDLYLSVEEPSGWLAVHEWTNVQYAAGKLDTQLKPGWWNASTGAGQVAAQVRSSELSSSSSETPADLFGGSCTLDPALFLVFATGNGQLSMVPSGQPSWNTPAPAGPVFAIAYNGSQVFAFPPSA